MGNLQDQKNNYGWSPELEKFFLSTNKVVLGDRTGTFQLRKKSGNLYWTFKFSRGEKRSIHLCPINPSDINLNQSSFDYCCKVLIEKLSDDYISKSKLNQPIHKLVDDFIHHTETRMDINNTTIQNKVKSIRQFGRFTRDRDYKINILSKDSLRKVIREYVEFLTKRELQSVKKGRLSRGSIKIYLQNVRYFFDWICKNKDEDGLELFPSHNFTLQYQNYLLKKLVPKPKEKHPERNFSKDSYSKIYYDCLKIIRDHWIYYCENFELKPIKDKNGKVNQPETIGTDIVFFISFFQLRYGFRIGEILHSYRNQSVYQEIGNSKDRSSYFFKEDGNWFLQIVNSKRKSRIVPITDTILSGSIPPNNIPHTVVYNKKGKILSYRTNIVDVIHELFPSSYFSFPSPNLHTKENRPYSQNYYLNLFKKYCVVEKEWKKYGISSSHNLRSFFISYCIHDGWTPNDICSITGHTINTMYKYYVREDLKSKFDLFMNTPQKNIINKFLERKES